MARLARAYGWKVAITKKRETVNWRRSSIFILLHLTPLLGFLVGVSWVAIAVAIAMYWIRMFFITGFYHRYFSHKSFKTTRAWQLVFAWLGNTAGQKGALWWAAHHRFHHRHADQDVDIHSPIKHGFWWSHVGWIISDLSRPTNVGIVKDLAQFPELRFLDKNYWIAPLVSVVFFYGLGESIQAFFPSAGTSGWQMVIWGFVASTLVLFHGTYTINSLAHRFGSRRFATRDTSRNNWWLAIITLGEGWHNNHHRFPSSARQGLRWYEIDFTWYTLLLLEKLRVISELRAVPKDQLDQALSQ